VYIFGRRYSNDLKAKLGRSESSRKRCDTMGSAEDNQDKPKLIMLVPGAFSQEGE
jgi:hypothetical protein